MKAKWIQASEAGFVLTLALGLAGCASPPEKKVSRERPAEMKQQSGKAASAPVPFKEVQAAPPAAQISVPAAPGGGCNCSCGSNPPQASGEATPADPLAGLVGPPDQPTQS